jgi:hypothetical protein
MESGIFAGHRLSHSRPSGNRLRLAGVSGYVERQRVASS